MESTPADRACPTCKQRFAQSLDVCPNCGRDTANPFVSPAVEEVRHGEEWRWIATVAIGVCVLCGALAFVAPGLAVFLLVLASPVLVRAWAMVERRREAGMAIDGYQRVQAIVLSGVISLLAGLAGAIAFAVICFPLGLVNVGMARSSGVGIVVAFAAGGIAFLAVVVFIMARYWPKRIDKPN